MWRETEAVVRICDRPSPLRSISSRSARPSPVESTIVATRFGITGTGGGGLPGESVGAARMGREDRRTGAATRHPPPPPPPGRAAVRHRGSPRRRRRRLLRRFLSSHHPPCRSRAFPNRVERRRRRAARAAAPRAATASTAAAAAGAGGAIARRASLERAGLRDRDRAPPHVKPWRIHRFAVE